MYITNTSDSKDKSPKFNIKTGLRHRLFTYLQNSLIDKRIKFQTVLYGKGKAIPLQAWTGPEGPEFEAPRFQDNRHMNVVRLSALSTGRLCRSVYIPGTHFC
jgi:hypothetical protein